MALPFHLVAVGLGRAGVRVFVTIVVRAGRQSHFDGRLARIGGIRT